MGDGLGGQEKGKWLKRRVPGPWGPWLTLGAPVPEDTAPETLKAAVPWATLAL